MSYQNRISLLATLALIMVTISCTVKSKTELKVSSLFGNNMVLQQNEEIPVWGMADANSIIKVKFREQVVSTESDQQGKWMAKLQPEPVGLNDSMIISCENQELTITNIAVGEVWIASGQSNMEVSLVNNWGPINNGKQEAANANFPNIRLFKVERNTTVVPVDTLKSAGWKICTPENVKDFSAVGYFFARELNQNLDIPIGIIQSAWGGTIAEAWTSSEMLSSLNIYDEKLATIHALPSDHNEQLKLYNIDYAQMQNEIAVADKGIEGDDSVYIKLEIDDTNWIHINLPEHWQSTALGNYSGSGWFRKYVELSAEDANSSLTLNIGSPDNIVEAWVNAVKVGTSPKWGAPQHYKIPAGVCREGKNIITLRVLDDDASGGFNGLASDFSLTNTTGLNLPISNNWLVQKGFDFSEIVTKPISPDDPNRVTTLFNGMIHPLISYSFRGVIWYQGESNTGSPKEYRDLFPALINDWRQHWDNGNFPFYFVQLANYTQRNTEPTTDGWAELREAQTRTLELPNTGMAVAIEIGDAMNIHPGNKQDVGKRLALWALNKTYKQEIPCSGPLFKSYTITKNQISIEFNYVYDELKTSDGKQLKGFAIAGSDQNFHWATAQIIGNKVVVSCDKVPNPVAVRYAWSANPECNLVNSANLPASPFRTDEFELN